MQDLSSHKIQNISPSPLRRLILRNCFSQGLLALQSAAEVLALQSAAEPWKSVRVWKDYSL
jgi:hypothetical protein